MINIRLAIVLLLFSPYCSSAQQPKQPTSSEIYESLQKLNFLGTVLYVAAHPDDENTKLIAYLSKHSKANTTYLSLTRGDGGQNLIGSELRELLGVIRTEELIAARTIDGGAQTFSRANDFGYSKHPKETLQIWNKKAILGDVVRAIRKFRPDVIINRFDHRTPGTTHGHHTASAMLSLEAFDLAGDVTAYPNQLNSLQPWQPQRAFFNTSWWFYGSQEKFENADKSKFLTLDTGVYYPSYGLSNSEIAALSRSQHRSQGFGTIGTRGSALEYLEPIKGSFPKNASTLFEGIDTSWNRVSGGQAIGDLVTVIIAQFDFKNPAASIPLLLQAYQKIQQLDDSYWKKVKEKEIIDIIAATMGLYVEVATTTPYATPESTVPLEIEAINRSAVSAQLTSVVSENLQINDTTHITLPNNEGKLLTYTGKIDTSTSYTNPYWLQYPSSLGMYTVKEEHLIGLPNTPNPYDVTVNLMINNTMVSLTRPMVYKKTDPVQGEVYQTFEIFPEVSVALEDDVIIFSEAKPKKVTVTVTPYHSDIPVTIQLQHPEGWKVSPAEITLQLSQKEERNTLEFTVTPPPTSSEGTLVPVVTSGSQTYAKSAYPLSYSHIPKQTVWLPAVAKVVSLPIQKKGQRIGYIEGAGDKVPESLRHIGYEVTSIDPTLLTTATLQNFDAIVVGIRAYNTVDLLASKQKYLLEYVKQGGTLIVQYNTSHRLKIEDNLGPYPLTLSRDRVTDEHAPVTFVKPEHPILTTPNQITAKDFEGWVQERGLYFPNAWDKAFTPIIEVHDKGESSKKGSLLVANYGKGHYIYTGLSFFRQLPAGVPGAYRLFANMLSIGN